MSTSKTNGVWGYFVCTYLYTWTFWGIAAISGWAWPELGTVILFALGGIGPALVATAFVYRSGSGERTREFWWRVFDPRRLTAIWYLVIPAVAVGPYLLARLGTGGTAGQVGIDASTAAAATFTIAILAGLTEEPGWRGYVLDRLQAAHSALGASLIVGVFWSLWHLPLFFIVGTYQNQLGLGTPEFWRFFAVIVPQSVIYAWIYNNTGRSILAVVLFHALSNGAGEMLSPLGLAGVAVDLAVAGIAVGVTLLWGPWTLAGRSEATT